jgi:hypothetical protein
VLGNKQPRPISLNWSELDYPSFNLEELELEITQEEIEKSIKGKPKDNAPGPDRFIGAFFL